MFSSTYSSIARWYRLILRRERPVNSGAWRSRGFQKIFRSNSQPASDFPDKSWKDTGHGIARAVPWLTKIPLHARIHPPFLVRLRLANLRAVDQKFVLSQSNGTKTS